MYISSDTITSPVILPGNLLFIRQDSFCMPQINNKIIAVKTLNNSIYDFTFAIDKTGVNRIPFGILHFLDNYLFGRLGSYASEGGCIDFCAQAVANLAIRIQLATFFETDLKILLCNYFGHIFKLEDFEFTDLFAVLHLDIDLGPKLFPGGRF